MPETPHADPPAITGGSIPKHAQLRAILDDLCITTLSVGDMLPGERAIEDAYGVSRITVRRAIGDLVASGRLRRVRGKGTFVAPSPLVAHLHLASFSDEMAAHGVTASSRVLASEKVTPAPPVASFFGTEPQTQQIHVQRLRLGDRQPYSIDDGWYAADIAPDLLTHDLTGSIYSLLGTTYSAPVTHAEQTVTAVSADTYTGPLLDVEPGTALLHVLRQSYSGDAPVEWCSSLYRSDRYRLDSTITRQHSS